MKEISLDTTYNKPFFGHPIFSGLTIQGNAFEENREEQSSFKQRTTKLNGMLETHNGHSLGYEAAFRDVKLKKGVDSQIVLDGGLSLKSSIIHKWKLDGRDDAILPLEGSAITIVGIQPRF